VSAQRTPEIATDPFDFNRLRRAGEEDAVPFAASIFLDVLNIFPFFLELFGGPGE
jgi:FtsH-binding integral membrane protein